MSANRDASTDLCADLLSMSGGSLHRSARRCVNFPDCTRAADPFGSTCRARILLGTARTMWRGASYRRHCQFDRNGTIARRHRDRGFIIEHEAAQRSGLHGQCSLLRAIGRSDQRRHAFAGVRTWTETKAIADVRR